LSLTRWKVVQYRGKLVDFVWEMFFNGIRLHPSIYIRGLPTQSIKTNYVCIYTADTFKLKVKPGKTYMLRLGKVNFVVEDTCSCVVDHKIRTELLCRGLQDSHTRACALMGKISAFAPVHQHHT
jgi:hypothetical protein